MSKSLAERGWLFFDERVVGQKQNKNICCEFAGEIGLYPKHDKRGMSGRPGGTSHQEDILYKWRLQRKLETAREGRYVPSETAAVGASATPAEVPLVLLSAAIQRSA